MFNPIKHGEEMKLIKFVSGAFLLCTLCFSTNLYAEEPKDEHSKTERVVTEKLYIYDPTVADKGWLFGLGLEAWYVVEDRDVVDANGNRIGESDKEGFLGGATLYAGKGDVTFFIGGKKGDFTYDYSTDINGTTVCHETEVDRSELELKLRWLFPKWSTTLFDKLSLIPYSMAGVNYLSEDNENLIKTSGYGFASTLSAKQHSERQYISPLLGLGVIVPISDSLGFRLDLVGNYSFAEKTWERLNQSEGKVSDEDWGYAAHATFYWAVTDNFNIQLGLKEQKLDGGDEVGRTYFSGAYTMFGYTF